MIVDTSALIAVFQREARADDVVNALVTARSAKISAATLVEVSAVIEGKRSPDGHARMRRLIAAWNVETVPFDADQAAIAQQAYRDYGRGSAHPANLNLGDCYSYALAAALNEPLLYIGDDFSHTDIRSAL